MRILLIAPQPFYTDRGSPIAIFEELKILSKLEFQVDVVTYPIGTDIRIPGVRIIRIRNPLRFRFITVGFSFRKVLLDLILLVTVLCLMRTKYYDCIHGVEEGGAIALVCKTFFGIPVIYDMHSSIPEQLRTNEVFRTNTGQKIALNFEKFLLKNADAILASSGLTSHVLSIVPNKVVWECHFPGNDPKNRSEALARKHKILGRPTVVYSGNFSSYQGLDLLIEAATILRLNIPDVVFLLLGGTKSDILPIAHLVTKHKVDKTVYLCQRVPRHEVANYLALADALVLPRRKGMNVPLKLFDYMKSQKPIVATDIPAHTALIDDKSAVLVKPEPEALAQGLLSVIQDKKKAFKLALEAESFARSIERNSLQKTLNEIYRYVMKGSVINRNDSF